jgi:hypothetical protein
VQLVVLQLRQRGLVRPVPRQVVGLPVAAAVKRQAAGAAAPAAAAAPVAK